ncbi:MAG: threonylcarbamoyl-AMP synthase [Acidobacteriaceae bacterium]|nr:threonylcarbamoyl-AMP synthase [Acidobacteriaceae bacterium]
MSPMIDYDRAAALLRAGRLVAFPTETVYGLGANALDAAAVRRIYEAKGRPSTSPLIVHVADAAMAKTVAAEWPEAAERLAARFWPGPLTLVLPKRRAVPDEVTAGLGTVGVRQPAHPVALELIRRAGVPLAGPSANRFMGLSPTTAEHVRLALGEAVDLVVDGGTCPVGIESTVLSLSGGRAVLLRPGMISRESIEAVIGPVEVAGEAAEGVAHEAPGMHARHYAPLTALRLGTPGRESGYVWHTIPAEAASAVRLPAEAEGYAAGLYGALHALDAAGLPEIVVEPVPEGGAWDGIRDRLTRASQR